MTSEQNSRKLVSVSLQDTPGGTSHRFGINAVTSCGTDLFTAGRDGTVRCWVPAALSAKLTLTQHADWVNDLVVLQRGVLASCSSDRTVKLLTLPGAEHRETKSEIIGRHGDYAKALVFADSCGMLCAAARRSRACTAVRSRREGARACARGTALFSCTRKPRKCTQTRRACVCVRARRVFVHRASAGFDRRLLLWDVHRFGSGHLAPVAGSEVLQNARIPRTAKRCLPVACCYFMPVLCWLVACNVVVVLLLRHSCPLDECAACLGQGGHSDSIYALDSDLAGHLLATGSVDTDVRLWDPRDLGSSLRLRGHSDVVRGVKLLPDGQRLLSCGSDRTLRVWHIGERRCEQSTRSLDRTHETFAHKLHALADASCGSLCGQS